MTTSSKQTSARLEWSRGTPLDQFVECRARRLLPAHGTYTSAHQAARDEVRRQLVAGSLVAYGRQSTPRSKIEEISVDVWIDSEYSDDDVSIESADYGRYVHIQIIELNGTNNLREIGSAPEPSLSTPGRPTRRVLIWNAIEHYSRQQTGWFKRAPRERFDAYKTYISAQGTDPELEPGFKDKTLQKYETEFRKKNR